jgi:hypothetical protein
MVAAAEIEYQHVAELRLAVDRLAELPPGQRVEKLVDVLRSEHRPYAVDRHAIADGQAAPSDPVVVILGAIGRHVGKQLADLLRPSENDRIVVERVRAGDLPHRR